MGKNSAHQLFDDVLAQRISRRELFNRAGRLGLGAMGTGLLLNTLGTAALADTSDFDWKKYKGKTINLLLNKHPYTNAMIAYLDNFKKLTGMNVKYDIFPEDVYFQKVTSALSSSSSQYDVFMTGAYQTWQYGPAGYLVDLKDYIKDSSKTADTYKWDDIQPNLRASDAWSGKVGDPLGGSNAKQWALPWGFELYSVSYNKAYFKKLGLTPPENLPDMIEKAQKLQKGISKAYGVSVRGSRSWATIHPGYLSGFANYGAQDFTLENGKLKPAMNSDAGKKFTKLWIEMVQKAGPKDWTEYTWYEVGQDLGSGQAAMIYDADILGFFQQTGTKEAGHIGYEPFTPNPDMKHPTSNVWIWSLAMSNFSRNKDAAWYFLQWATSTKAELFGATKEKLVDPTRQSVADDDDFKARLNKSYEGYLNTYKKTVPDAKIRFTPQPLFFNVTTQWAAELQRMYAKQVSVDEGMDKLAESIGNQLSNAGIG